MFRQSDFIPMSHHVWHFTAVAVSRFYAAASFLKALFTHNFFWKNGRVLFSIMSMSSTILSIIQPVTLDTMLKNNGPFFKKTLRVNKALAVIALTFCLLTVKESESERQSKSHLMFTVPCYLRHNAILFTFAFHHHCKWISQKSTRMKYAMSISYKFIYNTFVRCWQL